MKEIRSRGVLDYLGHQGVVSGVSIGYCYRLWAIGYRIDKSIDGYQEVEDLLFFFFFFKTGRGSPKRTIFRNTGVLTLGQSQTSVLSCLPGRGTRA